MCMIGSATVILSDTPLFRWAMQALPHYCAVHSFRHPQEGRNTSRVEARHKRGPG